MSIPLPVECPRCKVPMVRGSFRLDVRGDGQFFSALIFNDSFGNPSAVLNPGSPEFLGCHCKVCSASLILPA